MKLTIIGSGNVGLALGKSLVRAGYEVCFGVRDVSSVKTQKALAELPEARMAPLEESVIGAEIILITTPPEAVLELAALLKTCKDAVLVDASNAVRSKPEPYATAYHALKALTGSEKVVKCFNSTGHENLANPNYGSVALDMFAAGGDADSKQLVMKLAKDMGFAACYDVGGDAQVELLEKFALNWINLAIMQGQGRNIGFCVVRR
ncbi:MAG: NAD(P)-binding domain-containing protein [Cytophagaceae bacterium]|jgi:hypothetical protein|nr:NAD(P)-binding domain-containing protein [Cytophagaceae bacterium]